MNRYIELGKDLDFIKKARRDSAIAFTYLGIVIGSVSGMFISMLWYTR